MNSRGQTLPETALFLPLVLLIMFATIFLSQYGVLSERVQREARISALMNTSVSSASASLFSAAMIYNYAGTSSQPTCPAPSPAVLVNGPPLPGPTSPPYWWPSSTSGNPTCKPVSQSLPGAGFLAIMFAGSQENVSAALTPYPFLKPLFPNGATVSASETFAHPADPISVLQCTDKEVSNRLYAALLSTGVTPTPAPATSGSGTPKC
jgi:hypothetical protein